MESKKEKCHYCGEEKENCFSGYTAMILPVPEAEAIIDKWGRDNWWYNLERTDLTEDEARELESLATYDQLLNTIGKGVMCKDCIKEEDELYEKYYPAEYK